MSIPTGGYGTQNAPTFGYGDLNLQLAYPRHCFQAKFEKIDGKSTIFSSIENINSLFERVISEEAM